MNFNFHEGTTFLSPYFRFIFTYFIVLFEYSKRQTILIFFSPGVTVRCIKKERAVLKKYGSPSFFL